MYSRGTWCDIDVWGGGGGGVMYSRGTWCGSCRGREGGGEGGGGGLCTAMVINVTF